MNIYNSLLFEHTDSYDNITEAAAAATADASERGLWWNFYFTFIFPLVSCVAAPLARRQEVSKELDNFIFVLLRVDSFVPCKAELPHPVTACVYCNAVHFRSTYHGWPKQSSSYKPQNNADNACINRMCKCALLMLEALFKQAIVFSRYCDYMIL